MALLEVKDLTVRFARSGADKMGGPMRSFIAVNNVAFSIERGETVGLLGETGCGKSTLARAIVRLIEPDAGSVWFEGEDLASIKGERLRRKRQEIQMVFQDSLGSLSPRYSVGQTITEAIEAHASHAQCREIADEVSALMKSVGLREAHLNRQPHELSGGERQRVGIARALAVKPKLLICDEPVAALDVTVQAQVLNLLSQIQKQEGLAYLFISHDIAVIERICSRVLIMHRGSIIESGETTSVMQFPQHPYTKALIDAVPKIG